MPLPVFFREVLVCQQVVGSCRGYTSYHRRLRQMPDGRPAAFIVLFSIAEFQHASYHFQAMRGAARCSQQRDVIFRVQRRPAVCLPPQTRHSFACRAVRACCRRIAAAAAARRKDACMFAR